MTIETVVFPVAGTLAFARQRPTLPAVLDAQDSVARAA